MDKYELILRVSKAIDQKRKSMKKDILDYDREFCPETSPESSDFELRLGTSEYFLAQMNALSELNNVDAGEWEVLRMYWNGSLENPELLNYQNTTRCLIYHYLNEKPDVKPTGNPPKLMHREIVEFIQAIKEEGAGWETGINEENHLYNGQALGKYIVFHPFFPEDMIGDIKESIEYEIENYKNELQKNPENSEDFRKDFKTFKETLLDFPEEFNHHTGKHTDFGEKLYDMELLKEKAVHEITHNFLHRKADMKNQSTAIRSLNEGFAWFSHLYTKDGFGEPVVTAGSVCYDDPEAITWLTKLINARARDHFKISRDVTPIDWARKKGVQVFTGERGVRFNFLQFIKPEDVREEIQSLENTLEDLEIAREDVKKEIEFEKNQIYQNFPKDSLIDLTPRKRDMKIKMAERNPGKLDLEDLQSDYQLLYSHLYKLEKDLSESTNPDKIIEKIEKSLEEYFWKEKPDYEELKKSYEKKLGSALMQEKKELKKIYDDVKSTYADFNGSDDRPTIENLPRLIEELEKAIKEINRLTGKIDF